MSNINKESNFFYIYFQIIKKYKDFMEKSLKEYNLTPAEIDVLTFLVNNKEKNITSKDISLHRGISKGLVSRAVNEIKLKGYINTVENPDDKRSMFLILEDKKNPLLEDIKKYNKIFITQLLNGIDDMNEFMRINNIMLNNIKDIMDY